MIDKYTFWDIERLNPEEHGAPLLLASSEEHRLGWAANVAANIANLGIDTTLIGLIWDDREGEMVKNLVTEHSITLFPIVQENPTIVKERFMYHGRQIARVDKEKYTVLSMKVVENILSYITEHLPSVIVFSDYWKGIANTALLEGIKQISQEHGIKVIADVKPKNIDLFHGIYLIKPNFKEFCGMTWRADMDPTNVEEIEAYGKALSQRLQTNIIVTKWAEWASLITLEWESFHLSAVKSNVVDVTGAGDSFLAWLVLWINNWNPLQDSVIIWNKASWAVIAKLGTAVVQVSDLE